jgi:hypothetical protein
VAYPYAASEAVIKAAGPALEAIAAGDGLAVDNALRTLSGDQLRELSEAAQFLAETCDIAARTRSA